MLGGCYENAVRTRLCLRGYRPTGPGWPAAGVDGRVGLVPRAAGVFVQARVQVPEDALVGDFVFLDSANEHSGFYDNNNGLDYHVPVTGASGVLPPLHVAHISVEMAPIAKVGGMGDVVTALGRAVQEYGHEVEVRAASPPTPPYHLVVWGASLFLRSLFLSASMAALHLCLSGRPQRCSEERRIELQGARAPARGAGYTPRPCITETLYR